MDPVSKNLLSTNCIPYTMLVTTNIPKESKACTCFPDQRKRYIYIYIYLYIYVFFFHSISIIGYIVVHMRHFIKGITKKLTSNCMSNRKS